MVWQRPAGEREAQQGLNSLFIGCEVGKVIFGSPGVFTWDAAGCAWALKGFGAQPVKISKDLLLRCGKEVLDF
jgi:hypothetical protein